jgi:hypothetical protein
MRVIAAVLFGVLITAWGVLQGNRRFEADARELIELRGHELSARTTSYVSVIAESTVSLPEATTSAMEPPAMSQSDASDPPPPSPYYDAEDLLNRSDPSYLAAARAAASRFIPITDSGTPSAQWIAIERSLLEAVLGSTSFDEREARADALATVQDLRRRAVRAAFRQTQRRESAAADTDTKPEALAAEARQQEPALPSPAASRSDASTFAAESTAAAPQEAATPAEPSTETVAPNPAVPEKASMLARMNAAIAQFFEHIIEAPKVLLPFLLGTLYYLVMICGIFTGSIYDRLSETDAKKQVRLKQLMRHATTAGTWQGVIVSPFIFALMKGAIPDDGFNFSMALLAFENGFFWRATMRKIEQIREKRATEQTGEPKKPAAETT